MGHTHADRLHGAHLDVVAAQTIQAEPVPNTLELFEPFAAWFNQDLTDSNVWMAIVH